MMINPMETKSNVGFILLVKLKTKETNKIMMLMALQPSAIKAILRSFINRLIVPFEVSVIELVS